jgi:hypothetical protein
MWFASTTSLAVLKKLVTSTRRLEEAKKKDPTTIKRLINAELEYTSTTAILIG